MGGRVRIAPSMLSANHGDMINEVKKVESWGADWLHIDIMDGRFAPNLTFGPGMVKAIRPHSRATIDCHLMLSEPEKYAGRFLEAGADYVSVHSEALTKVSLSQIEDDVAKNNGNLGIAYKPATELSAVDLGGVDYSMLLVMTVNPGFSGQKFMSEVVPKVHEASMLSEKSKNRVEIQVDGGVDISNARTLKENGATVLVAGNSIFGSKDPERAFKELNMAVVSNA
jgi:ribulose-phosphate 3-epimerase